MPLPAGFKVNGTKTKEGMPTPPRVRKIIVVLDSLPASELITSMELAARLGMATGGSTLQFPGLQDYREKVDSKLFWGSRKSIAQLRKQLASPEGTDDKN